MKLPDPLLPYANLIKWGLIALIVFGLPLGGFITGCNHGVGKEKGRTAEVQSKLDEKTTEAAASAEALNKVNEQTAENLRKANEAKEKAEREALAAAADKLRAEQEAAEAEEALERAKRKPTCRAQLEMKLCDDIPLL